jgi:integrase
MTTRAVQVSTIPSIEIFVRHSAVCPRRDDPEYKKCNCPKHLRYTHNGKQRRQSAKTRAWKIAEERRPLKGAPIEEVSKALGHDSIRTTEKHYAKWVKARQDRLDAVIAATWTKRGKKAKA